MSSDVGLEAVFTTHAKLTHEQYMTWQKIMMLGRDYQIADPTIDDSVDGAGELLAQLQLVKRGQICNGDDICCIARRYMNAHLHKGSFMYYYFMIELGRVDKLSN